MNIVLGQGVVTYETKDDINFIVRKFQEHKSMSAACNVVGKDFSETQRPSHPDASVILCIETKSSRC